jgi:hypothetical protein
MAGDLDLGTGGPLSNRGRDLFVMFVHAQQVLADEVVGERDGLGSCSIPVGGWIPTPGRECLYPYPPWCVTTCLAQTIDSG